MKTSEDIEKLIVPFVSKLLAELDTKYPSNNLKPINVISHITVLTDLLIKQTKLLGDNAALNNTALDDIVLESKRIIKKITNESI